MALKQPDVFLSSKQGTEICHSEVCGGPEAGGECVSVQVLTLCHPEDVFRGDNRPPVCLVYRSTPVC